MRDLELMLEILKEMSEEPNGCINVLESYGSESDAIRRHHADLLRDTGLAKWKCKGDCTIRITNQGYDFLNAIETDKPKYLEQCKQLLDKGVSFLKVVNNLISVANNIQI